MTSPLTKTAWFPDWRTALSALLIVAAFPPMGLSFLIWFSLVPWLWVITEAERPRTAALQGVWLSVLMSCLGFYWVAYVLHEFGEVPWTISVIGLLLYSLGGQPQFLVFGILQNWAPRPWRGRSPWQGHTRGALHWLALTTWLSLLYVGIDWLIPKLFKDTLGHSLYLAPWLRQLADLGGAHLLTFLIFWVNYALFTLSQILVRSPLCARWLTREIPAPSRVSRARLLSPAIAPVLSTAVLVALGLAYGRSRDRELQQRISHPRRSVNASVIQANIGDFDKVAAEHGLVGAGENVITEYLDLSAEALRTDPRPDFLVWPETSYPSTFGNPVGPSDLALEHQIEDFVQTERIPLLFGGYDRAGGKDFNALFALSPEKVDTPGIGAVFTDPWPRLDEDLQVYRKNILLLFGEYIPFTENFPWFNRLFPQVANFGRGPGPEVLEIPVSGQKPGSPGEPLKAGPVICYEALFPGYVIESAKKGSDLILNITNDSWFGPYGEPILHLSLSVFRSIETRLPQLRSTNTGISALILPDGSISRHTGIGTREIMNVTIPVIPETPTLMKLWGDWFGRLALFLGAFGALAVYAIQALRLRRMKPAGKTSPLIAP